MKIKKEEVKSKSDSAKPQNPLKPASSIANLIRFCIPGLGFGGTFLLISAVIVGVLFVTLGIKSALFPPLLEESTDWDIQITPPPAIWQQSDISLDIKKQNPDLAGLSYDDPDLLEQISNQLNLITIVKKVKSVSKRFPHTIFADVEYRLPVAMIYVVSDKAENGFFPVDDQGVLLPTRSSFSKTDIQKYIRVFGIKSYPANPQGQPWGDRWVTTSAQIASELAPYKNELGIFAILIHESIDKNAMYNKSIFDIKLNNDTIIRWTELYYGPTEIKEVGNQLSTQAKIAIMRKTLKEKGEIKALPGKNPQGEGNFLQFSAEQAALSAT